ncbi:MAG TPA: tRNA (adenosine(37)-N6)-threonylcarbamoyltransferase complex ATPase subunit type 1 TsaE [Bacteroidales bacterium]|nr:tRNA (adenosine(37)-N6)-threonylcarbamoyltransferase complex ATPase subunit type 1 TsaE [Bacteroidales bacterium]
MISGKEYKVTDQGELSEVAQALIATYPDSRIFAFFGPMGVGKTTFIKAVCSILGSTDEVTSPSFSIINQYYTQSNSPIFHFDFYRINHLDEVFNLGYEDYFFSGNFCLIEWPEKVEMLLPETCIRVFMELENGSRVIRF